MSDAPQPTTRQHDAHEIANLLSIALANVEAMVDGALDATPERLENVCQALRDAREHLNKL